MILGSNQPYLFPYIAYWQLMNYADCYVISDNMQYIRKGYINRNNILIDAKPHLVTLEVLGVHSDKLINELKVGRNARKILRSIFHAYKQAPYFEQVFPLMEKILLNEEQNLAKYVGFSIENIARFLNIKTKFIYLSDLQGETPLAGQERTIDICKRVGADHYINAIGGQELYDKQSFLAEGIDMSFLKTSIQAYPQFNHPFIANLSIIDIMMFNSNKQIREMLTKFTLI